jgi:vacuolar-type H+-ATPase subunit C/Vma6
MVRRGDSTKYGFAVGRVMVLRTRLLGRVAYERLLDAPTLADQRRILSETHLGTFVESVRTPSDVERAIDESLRGLYEEFLERAGLPAEVVGFFRSPHDFSVLKGVLKARVLGAAAEYPVVGLGSVPLEAFSTPEVLPGILGATARAVLAAQPQLDAESVDAAVDRAMFTESARLARASRVGFLRTLAESEADVANAKVLLRCAIAARDKAAAAEMLVPGGRWDAVRALELVARPRDLAEAVTVARILPSGAMDDLLDLAKLDVLADSAIARLARDAARTDTASARRART